MTDTTKYEVANATINMLDGAKHTDRHEYWAEFLTKAVNGRLSAGDGTAIAKQLKKDGMHRYLQSQLILFCLNLLREMGNQVFTDGRNEHTVWAASRIADLMDGDTIWTKPTRWVKVRLNEKTFQKEYQDGHEWGPLFAATVYSNTRKETYYRGLMQEGEEWEQLPS